MQDKYVLPAKRRVTLVLPAVEQAYPCADMLTRLKEGAIKNVCSFTRKNCGCYMKINGQADKTVFRRSYYSYYEQQVM